jgi:hypothetical protein
MRVTQGEIFCLKAQFHTYSESTGLKVNFSKSLLLPINISKDKANQLAGIFSCTVGSYPFTYIGLLMGTTKPKVEDHTPLANKIERRIIVMANWLSMAGRATLVDFAVSSVPIYTMCSLKMHVTNLNSIDRAWRHGLWRGSDVVGKGKPLVAWKKVTMPKDKGGMGLKNLKLMNEALLIKHLHKFYNKYDIPWVQLIWHTHYASGLIPHAAAKKGSFWFRDVMKYVEHFRGVASASTGPGDTVLLWEDVWNGHFLANELPRLYSYGRNKINSVAQFMGHPFSIPQSNFGSGISIITTTLNHPRSSSA